MARAANYHRLGRAIRRVMSAENVQASNFEEIGERATRGGYKADGNLVSSYSRLWNPKGKGERPRSVPPPEFVLALIRGGEKDAELDGDQQEDLIESWLSILPDVQRRGFLDMCAKLQEYGPSTEAWRDMLDFEARREARGEADKESGERRVGDRDL